jgi:hypothetical protein
MTSDSTKTVRWELVFHEDGAHAWSWRRIGADGAIEQTSEPHADFGKALVDAIMSGFHPKHDHWVLRSERWTTHFPPGDSPIATGPGGQVVQRRDAPRRSEPPLAAESATRVHTSEKADLERLLAEIRRRARLAPAGRVDPIAAIVRHVADAPHTPENWALVKIAAAINRGDGELEKEAVSVIGEEGLGLLAALIESKLD